MKTPPWAKLRGRLDAFDLAVLLALTLLSVWLLFVLARGQSSNHIWIGTDGPYVGDQLQYLAWVRESARQVLIANPFKLEPSAASFLHPGLVLSGTATRIGVAPWIAYLMWKPVAVLSMFVAVRAYARRVLTGRLQRRCALIIALFYISPVALLADHVDFIHDPIALQATASEMWPGLYFWGYPFTAIAVAALPAALLAYERDRREERVRPWAPLLGLVCAWLQPWQGATLLVILLITEMFLWRVNRLPRLGLLAATAFATVAPLCYYAILSRLDASWTLAGEANRVDLFPSWTLALSLAPLAIPAAFAYTRRYSTFQGLALRIWAPTAVAIYFAVGLAHVGTFPLHALQGLSIPLAVLAVAGTTAIAPNLRPAAKVAGATVLVVVLVVPALVRELDRARGLAKTDATKALFFGDAGPYVTASESHALDYLQSTSAAGGVLASRRMGPMVPAQSDRRTWVGLLSWTPNFERRARAADALLAGRLRTSAARSLVRTSGARFVLSDCRLRADLTTVLRPMLESVRHSGCATVYRVRAAGG